MLFGCGVCVTRKRRVRVRGWLAIWCVAAAAAAARSAAHETAAPCKTRRRGNPSSPPTTALTSYALPHTSHSCPSHRYVRDVSGVLAPCLLFLSGGGGSGGGRSAARKKTEGWFAPGAGVLRGQLDHHTVPATHERTHTIAPRAPLAKPARCSPMPPHRSARSHPRACDRSSIRVAQKDSSVLKRSRSALNHHTHLKTTCTRRRRASGCSSSRALLREIGALPAAAAPPTGPIEGPLSLELTSPPAFGGARQSAGSTPAEREPPSNPSAATDARQNILCIVAV